MEEGILVHAAVEEQRFLTGLMVDNGIHHSLGDILAMGYEGSGDEDMDWLAMGCGGRVCHHCISIAQDGEGILTRRTRLTT